MMESKQKNRNSHRSGRTWRRWLWALPASVIIHMLFIAVIDPPMIYAPWEPVIPVSAVRVPPEPMKTPSEGKESGSDSENINKPVKKVVKRIEKQPEVRPSATTSEVALKKQSGEKQPAESVSGIDLDGSVMEEVKSDASTGLSESDASISRKKIAEASSDAGPQCEPDLLVLAPENKKWVLWIRLGPFRASGYGEALNRVLESFPPYEHLSGGKTGGIKALYDLNLLAATAANPFDWKSFFILADTAVPLTEIRRRIENSAGENATVMWRSRNNKTWGQRFFGEKYEIEPLLWYTAYGRILRISPLESIVQGKKGADRPVVPEGDGPLVTMHPPPLKHPFCLSEPAGPDGGIPDRSQSGQTLPSLDSVRKPVNLAQILIKYSDVDDPPAAVLATGDMRTVGLAHTGSSRKHRPVLAGARAFINKMPRLEMFSIFRSPQAAKLAAAKWKAVSAKLSRDPWLVLARVNTLFTGASIHINGNTLKISLKLNKGQIEAALLFLELQGSALKRRQSQSGSNQGGI